MRRVSGADGGRQVCAERAIGALSDVRELLDDLADVTAAVCRAEATSEKSAAADTVQVAPATSSAFSESLPPLPPSQRRTHVETAVLRVVNELTGASTSTFRRDAADGGGRRLARRDGALVAPALAHRRGALADTVFEQPTPRAIAAHLSSSFTRLLHRQSTPVAARVADANAPLAVVGMVGRWPGGCNDEATRWELQAACGDALGSVPLTRWVLEQAVDVSTLSTAQAACVRHGGFVAGAQRFDAPAFGISPAEAGAMDPQQRLLLDLGYSALHGSSHRRMTLMAGDGGVFLGIERPDWALAQPPSARGSVYAVTGDNVSAAAGRVSFTLGMQGPCSSVDTACASSLAALHGGAHAVAGGESGAVLALAVSLKLVPHGTLGAASAGMLSIDGRCKTLDARANGYARSEGGRARAAPGRGGELRLHGSAVRQDGRSASLTAPNGSAQRTLLLAPSVAHHRHGRHWRRRGAWHGHGVGRSDRGGRHRGARLNGARSTTRGGRAKASAGHSEAASGQAR